MSLYDANFMTSVSIVMMPANMMTVVEILSESFKFNNFSIFQLVHNQMIFISQKTV